VINLSARPWRTRIEASGSMGSLEAIRRCTQLGIAAGILVATVGALFLWMQQPMFTSTRAGERRS